MSFKSVALFGGTIEVELPSSFADVSNLRQVPDHQEVYIDSDGFTSVVIEILERVDKPDYDALRYHLEDLVEGDISATKVIATADARFQNLPPATPAYTLLAACPPDASKTGRENEPDFTAIYLILLRLESRETDLLIVTNVPFIKDKYDSSVINADAAQFGALGDSAIIIRDKILQTFAIRDWSLFSDVS